MDNKREIQDIISKLTFISLLKSGEKIDVNSISIHTSGYLGKLYRTFWTRNESRDVTYEFLVEVVNTAISLVLRCFSKKDNQNHQLGLLILDKLKLSRQGINCLKDTYRDDRMFSSKLETLIGIMNIKISELEDEQMK